MASRFTLRQLEYFVAVGETGSILSAAETLHVSSPSISAALSQLETEFGLQLFIRRHAKGLSLTQAGRQLMGLAKEVLAGVDAMKRLSADLTETVQGPLALGCLLTFAQMIVPQLRRQFETLYPGVRVRQSELHQQEIFDQLRIGQIDIALTYDLEIASDLHFIPLVALPPYVVVPQDHPLADLSAVSVEGLKPYPMVLLDLPYSSDYFLSFFQNAGIKPLVAERTRDLAAMRGLVANGYGYGIANIRPLGDLSPDGKPLCFVPLLGPVRPMQMGLLMVDGAQNVLVVKAFINHARSLITEDAVPGLNMRRLLLDDAKDKVADPTPSRPL